MLLLTIIHEGDRSRPPQATKTNSHFAAAVDLSVYTSGLLLLLPAAILVRVFDSSGEGQQIQLGQALLYPWPLLPPVYRYENELSLLPHMIT